MGPRTCRFFPHKKANTNAKQVARGNTSPHHSLPKPLKKDLPASISAIFQAQKTKIHNRWLHRWKALPRYCNIHTIDKSTPLKKWLNLVTNLSWAQASLLLQLHSGHIGQNKHLHHIKHTNSPACPNCLNTPQETIHHFFFECDKFQAEHFTL